MTVDSQTKIIVLPDQYSTFKIINLPNPAELVTKKSYLLAEDDSAYKIFELREVNGNNPYSSNNILLPKSSDSVKSWIIETSVQNGPKLSSTVVSGGYILQSPNLIVSSIFNPAYLLASIFCTHAATFSKRFITIEDFIDTLSGLYEDLWVQELPQSLYSDCLPLVCDTIVENGETFYKFSMPVTLTFLKSKVAKLVEHFLSSDLKLAPGGQPQFLQHIKSKLYERNQDQTSIPEDILRLAVEKHVVDLILGSYCLPSVLDEYLKTQASDFSKYDLHLKELEQKKKDLAMVEQNMNDIAESSAKASANSKSKKKPDPKKKPVKKVAVGKGALDGFFKKAT